MSSPTLVSSEKVQVMNFGFAQSQALRTAVELDVFTPLERGPSTSAVVARRVHAAERGVRMLLDVLVAFELLAKKQDRYALTPVARRFLLPDGEAYVGGLTGFAKEELHAWDQLTQVIKTGRPAVRLEHQKKAEQFFVKLVKLIFPNSYQAGLRAGRAMGVGTRLKGLKVLDVAAGAGAWGIAMATLDRAARVTANDFPDVLRLTRRMASTYGVSRRVDYFPGSLREADFGKGRYDLVILGHICHTEGVRYTQQLLRKSFRALRPGGHVLIAEIMPNDGRTGGKYQLLFALNMLVHTQEGDVFTVREFRRWLDEIGFSTFRLIHAGATSPVIVAGKPI